MHPTRSHFTLERGSCGAHGRASRQSARDWSGFLESRSSELRDGGKLLCLVIISTGRPVNSDLLWTHLWESILELGREGKFTEAEQLQITVPDLVPVDG